jgi:hypothetical protein
MDLSGLFQDERQSEGAYPKSFFLTKGFAAGGGHAQDMVAVCRLCPWHPGVVVPLLSELEIKRFG